jgi:HD-like signal output (HDOD) protein
MQTAPLPRATNPQCPEAAAFLEALTAELETGQVDLPSFPDVSLQVQRLLMDDNVSTDKVVRVVGLEPVLAGRVMQLASSAALNPRGNPILELRTAVARLGFDALRAASVSFAMTQLRLAAVHKAILQPLTALWKDNVAMAATACVVARRCHRVSPDTALFAGLVSGVGKICLLARASRHPKLVANPAAYHELVRDWHAEVATAVLRGWAVAEDIVDAVYSFQQPAANRTGYLPLSDVLAISDLVSLRQAPPELLMEELEKSGAAVRLGLNAAGCLELVKESESELAVLRGALE